MKTVGLITEYNPFHKGHRYHLEQAKKLSGAKTAIVLMSGNYVQRGTPAFLDKYTRADIALKNGADLVLELPLVYACASAEIFARGAVSILDRIGITDYLCFGTEDAEIPALKNAAEILLSEPDSFKKTLKASLKSGNSFPAARREALISCCPEALHCISSPNNLLGIEYMKALLSRNSSIIPVTIRRIHAGYHDADSQHRLFSATALRSIAEESTLLSSLSEIDSLYQEEFHRTFPVQNRDFDLLLGEKLLTACNLKSLTEYSDLTEDLARSILKNLDHFMGFDEFIRLLKSKNLTYTRLSRCLLHILLGIRSDFVTDVLSQDAPHYVRVLGFTEKGRTLLGRINPKISLLIKTAGYERILSNPADLAVFEQNLSADKLYRMVVQHKYGQFLPTEFTKRVTTISSHQ